MRKVTTETAVQQFREEGAKRGVPPFKSWSDALTAFREDLYKDFTIKLAVLPEVKYDSKTDRYVISFQTAGSDAKHSAKATDEAAVFLLSVLSESQYKLFGFKFDRGWIADVVAEAY